MAAARHGRWPTLIDTLQADASNVLISAWNMSATPETRVEKLDVYTGRRVKVASAPVRRATFLTDVAGRVRFAEGARDDNFSKLYYRDSDDGEWRLINDEAQTGHYESALGFSADGITAYLQVMQSTGPDAVVAWNTRTGERRQVQRDDTVDPYGTIHDRDARTLIGMQYMAEKVRTRLFDETTDNARIHRALAKAFPDAGVTITSLHADGRLALVQVWNDRTPGDTYLLRHAGDDCQWGLCPARMVQPRQASSGAGGDGDGSRRPGIARLSDAAAWRQRRRSLPMVVMPHGGPFGIFDELSFDDDTHMLTEAGYAVLRINFRGSGNYGARFRHAGAREWGGRMQDDLTDATRWAIEQEIADPARICIYGASYGGYAALMGAARAGSVPLRSGLCRCL